MDNDTGRESRSNEPPKLAPVRRLHLDDGEGSSATATEEWYETERLTGQITGRRNAPPVEPLRDEALVVLDWRHPESATAPNTLQRFGGSLAAHGHRVVSLFVLAGHRKHELAAAGARNAAVPTQPKARRPRLTMLSTRRAAAPPTAEQEDKPTVDEILAAEPSSPRTAPRSSADLTPQQLNWRSAPAPKTRRDRHPRPWALGLIGAALVVTAATAAVIAITSSPNGRDSHQASFAAATATPRVALIAAGKTMIGVLGSVEHQTRTTPARQRNIARRADPHRRPHHNAQHRHSRPAHPHTSSPAPQAPAALPATNSTGGGSTISTGASNSQNSAAPSASSSQSTSPTPATSQSQPAGPTGPAAILGPGHCSC